MTTQRDPETGSQRYVPPNLGVAFDYQALLNNTGLPGNRRPLAAPMIDPAQPVRGKPGLYRGRFTLRDWGGPVRQEGPLEECINSLSSGNHVGDEWDIARHSLITGVQSNAAALPTAGYSVDRCWGANVLSQHVIGLFNSGTPELFEESGFDLIKHATYAPPAATTGMTCGGNVQFGGTAYLGIGFLVGAQTIQLVSNLSAFASITLNVGAASTYGFCQVPGVGTPLVVYNGTSLLFIPTDGTAAAGIAAMVTRTAGIPVGGYMAGLLSLGGGAPYIAIVAPYPANGMTIWGGGGYSAAAEQCKVLLFDLNGYARGELTFPMPYVRFATVFGPGLFACGPNGEHYYHKGGTNPIPVDLAQDHAPDSNLKRVCRGHTKAGTKILYEINKIADTGSTSTTKRETWEYDPHLNIAKPVSPSWFLEGTGVKSIGGPDLPFSENTRCGRVLSANNLGTSGFAWWRQLQPAANTLGYNLRKTPGASAGSGRSFENAALSTTPKFTSYPGIQGPVKFVTVGVTPPPVRNIATGEERSAAGVQGTFTTGANMTVSELASGKSWTFTTREPLSRRPTAQEPRSDAWSDYLQFSVLSNAQTGGTDPLNYTPNVLPITVDVLIRTEELPEVSPNWANWGKATTVRVACGVGLLALGLALRLLA